MKTKQIKIGDRLIGGDNPILIQSMTTTKPSNIKETLEQIKRLEEAGCEIIRVAVSSEEDAKALGEIKEKINVPIVADIQFDPELAKLSIINGADKIRINPGNIGSREEVREIVELAKVRGIPIRVGINAGSLEKDLLEKYGRPTPEALFKSADRNIKLLEEFDFDDIVMSIKASNVEDNIKANQLFSEKYNYPIHLGITEAGSKEQGLIKSSIGIGSLLLDGVGDTIRVSLTGDPVQEIEVAKTILTVIGKGDRFNQVEIISCPTCGRTEFDLEQIIEELREKLPQTSRPLKLAVMGCPVNGPGEAREADLGLACAKSTAVLFSKGKAVKTVSLNHAVDSLIEEMKNYE